MKEIQIRTVTKGNARLPEYGSQGASGADVRAYVEHEITLAPGTFSLIPTGLKMEIPEGYEIQVRPRSGLALKHGIAILNAPGTIDADYRGEIRILLLNQGDNPFTVLPGMRIAQLVVSPIQKAQFLKVNEEQSLTASQRGEGGFGHTGLN